MQSVRSSKWQKLSADSSLLQLCLQDQCQRQLSEHGGRGALEASGQTRGQNRCNIWVARYASRLSQPASDRVFWSCSSRQWIKGGGGGSPAPNVRPPGEFPHPDSPGQTGCLVSRVKSRNSIISSKVYQRLHNPPLAIVKQREADQQKKNRYSFLKIQAAAAAGQHDLKRDQLLSSCRLVLLLKNPFR